MTEGLEKIKITKILEHQKSDCPFCKSDEEEKPDCISDDNADWEDDVKEAIGNNSGKLETNMEESRPQNWFIDVKVSGKYVKKNHKVTPNPHHLIPGNESLKKSKSLLEFIFAKYGIIENDIGYDVNNGENGIWVPSNNAMRGDALWKSEAFKTAYVVSAMDEAGTHFHDRHNSPYSKFITKILNKIADRMNGIDTDTCPYISDSEKEPPYKPPYALIPRLNGVSLRVGAYLNKDARPNASLYTSKLVLKYWKAKGRLG